MKIYSTRVSPISESEDRVEIVFGDDPDRKIAKLHLRAACTIETKRYQLLTIQSEALRALHEAIGKEIDRIRRVSG
jgi:hypothetical protein